jgi:uncharacterized membrane protein (Fun14 family)
MNIENFGSEAAVTGGGFIGGLLLGYALKKVVRLIAVVVGLLLAVLAYLQYQHIASFDWNRIERIVTTTLGNVTSQISGSQDGAAVLAMPNFGIPLTSSMSAGIAVGFMKG